MKSVIFGFFIRGIVGVVFLLGGFFPGIGYGAPPTPRLLRPGVQPAEGGSFQPIFPRSRWYRNPSSVLPQLPRRAPGLPIFQLCAPNDAPTEGISEAVEVIESGDEANWVDLVDEANESDIASNIEPPSAVYQDERIDYFSNANPDSETPPMNVTSAPFGKTDDGKDVTVFTLTNKNGLVAKILDFGGLLFEMNTPDRNGSFENISCNFPTVAEYQNERPYFGSLVGRYANRIAKGRFTLDGVEYQVPINNGENALHGGLKGFDQVLWSAEPFWSVLSAEPFSADDVCGVKLTYTAADGEEGYPGNLTVEVVYMLNNKDELTIGYTAMTDKATVLNLTNHTFWNLSGGLSGLMLDTELQIGASHYLPADEGLIPTGEIASVEGTPLDFTTPKPIGRDIGKITEPQFNGGYDHCFVINASEPGGLTFCAKARDPKSGRTLEIETTEPGVQFYSGNFFDGKTGVGDYRYEKHSAFCLETNHYPDSPNHPEFPTTVLRPGEVYRQTTVHRFGVE